jgi:hypothetical protein
MSDGTVAEFLREHPRLLGVLFGATVLLTQVGAAAAEGAGTTVSGP